MQDLKALLGLVAILVAYFGTGSVAAAEPSAAPAESKAVQRTPLVADVLAAPHAVRGSDGRTHLVYEIRIANATDGQVSLKRINVLDGRSGTTMAALDAQAIGGRFSLGGRRGSESNELGASQFGVAFMHVALEANAPIPAALLHAVEGHAEKANADFVMRAAATPVVSADPPVLGPLLRGQGYVAADGCCDSGRCCLSTVASIWLSASPSTGSGLMMRHACSAATRKTCAAIASTAIQCWRWPTRPWSPRATICPINRPASFPMDFRSTRPTATS
jgi:hypothetical protein